MPLAPAALPRRSVPPAAAVLRSGARLGALRPPSWGLGVTHGRHVPHRLNFASQVRGVLAGHPQGRLCDRVVLQRGGRRPAPYAGELVSGLRLPVGWPRQAGPRDGSNGKCRAAAPLRRAGSTRPPGSSQRRGGGSLYFRCCFWLFARGSPACLGLRFASAAPTLPPLARPRACRHAAFVLESKLPKSKCLVLANYGSEATAKPALRESCLQTATLARWAAQGRRPATAASPAALLRPPHRAAHKLRGIPVVPCNLETPAAIRDGLDDLLSRI